MKNNTYYTSFEKYQTNPIGRYSENKNLNNNSNYNNNTSFENQNNYLKRSEPEPYPTLVSEPSKSNKDLKNLTNNNPSNKNYFYRDYYETEVYQPQQYEYGTYDINYQNNWNMRPFGLYTQSTKNNESKKNNMLNAEDDSLQSNQKNHSYYESKYSKKKIHGPRAINNTINNYRINTKNINPNQSGKYTISNISLNKNANKSNIINKTGDNKYIINNSPTIKRSKETYFYNLQNNNKINISDNNEFEIKKNLTLKNSSLINDINRFKQSNNNRLFSSAIQPRTPSVYSHHTIRSPLKKLDDESYIPNSKKIYYDKTERTLPSKSLEKMAFRKLVFNYQNTLNNMKNDESDYNNLNLTDKFNAKSGKVPYTPIQFRSKNLTNIYKNVNEDNKKFNSNITISINNRNEDRNNLSKSNNTESYIIDHNKTQTEAMPKQLNNLKDEKKLPKENNDKKAIKPTIKEIYVKNINKKNISPKNDIVKTVISKIKSNNDNINQNKTPISNISKIFPTSNNTIISTKQKNIINENKNIKEVDNIKHDNYAEPTIQNKYTFEIRPRNDIKEIINNKSLNYINMPKGKNEQNKDIMNKRYSHVIPMTEIKKAFTSEIMDINNKNNNNRILHATSGLSNLNNLDKNDKLKSQEIQTNKLTNNLINNNKLNTSKKNIKEDISKTEKKISNLSKKNLFNTIPNKNLNLPEKTSNPIPKVNPKKEILSLLIKNEKEKVKEKIKEKAKDKEKERPHRFQSEMLKYESRAREKSIKKEEKKDDEWGDIEFKGLRKTTYDVRRRGKKNKNTNIINDDFHSTIYIKKSEALTIPGKNEYGNRKTNQDTFILEKNVNGVLNFNIFGVLDGHGDNGHFASQFVSRYVIHRIKNHPSIKKLDEPQEIYHKLIANGYSIIASIYLDADVQIKKEKFDVTRSGTTIVLVIQLEEHIICANTGDSRAIAIYDNSYDDKLVHSKIYPLSYDCKPELPNEKKRITECGGVVEKAYYSDDEDDDDEIPFRVWAKGEDYPGLAMSRSIGDMDAKKVGVIPNPQIVTYTIDYYSKYIVMGSDGIWEFISNEEAMKIANKFYLSNDPKGLCHELVNKATKLWEEKDVVIDDITVLVVFF